MFAVGKIIVSFFVAAVLCLQTSCALYLPASGVRTDLRREIIIDPGHGGIDGGAVGVSGTVEKEVNLAISLALRDLLVFMGYNVIMTRDTDISIHDPDATTVRQMKTSDLHNRLKIAVEHESAAYISIHQNNFYDHGQSGMCFYYSPNNGKSKVLAENLRSSLLEYLQPDNRRQLKEAGDNLFIMYNAPGPAVLVECGFLSNPEEEKLLCESEYQIKICLIVAAGINITGL